MTLPRATPADGVVPRWPAPSPTGAVVDGGPLSGLRVLDLSRILSGPFCTMVLGDLGADVIKIEEPSRGDETRHWGPPYQGDQTAYFLSVNRNKRSVAIDLKAPSGLRVVDQLALGADVLVENFRPGTAERLGLGYPQLSKKNPGLVYVSISAYGQTGPMQAVPGYDAVAQAVSGMMSVTGEADGPPVRAGVSIADIGAGMWAALGALAALVPRERSGRGQWVDVSLHEGLLAWLTYVAAGYFASGKVPGRYGSGHPTIVPYQAFDTADGSVMVAVGNEKQWRSFARVLGLEDLAEDPRFATNADRVRHRVDLVSVLRQTMRSRSANEWVELLSAADVPAGAINTVDQALAHPQVTARGLIKEVDHPSAGRLRTVMTPIRLSGEATAVRRPPPRLGEHTIEVLQGLDIGEPKIAEMLQERGGTVSGNCPPSNSPAVSVAVDGPVAWLTVGDGARRNALKTQDWRQVEGATAHVGRSTSVRVMVVRGQGDGFCAGSDVGEWFGAGLEEIDDSFEAMEAACSALEALDIPVVAQIAGVAAGAGCQLALAADLRIMAADGQIGMPTARFGILPTSRFIDRITRVAGPATAFELLATGRLLGAKEAASRGLVGRVVPPSELRNALVDVVDAILAQPDEVLHAIKRGVIDGAKPDRGADLPKFSHAVVPDAIYEGVQAFLGRSKHESPEGHTIALPQGGF